MNQTKLGSFIVTALTVKTNLMIGLSYTIVSVARSYVIRRWFQKRLHAAAMRLARSA